MALLYYPSAGEIVMCRYDDAVIAPEMRKARPVVVVGPRLRHRGRLATVVPLSTTEPRDVQDCHCALTLAEPLPPPFNEPRMWAKCDMIATVWLDRLDRFKERRSRDQTARRWTTGHLADDQLRAVRCAVLHGLGLSNLTNQL